MLDRTVFLFRHVLLRSLIFVVGSSLSAGAVGLDAEGGCGAPCYVTFACHRDVDLVKASGRPHFKITLAGHCGAQEYHGPPGWKHVLWKDVTVKGTFNYDTGVAEETIWIGPDVIIEAKLQCDKNPWAHGNTCTPTQQVTNNTEVYNLSNQTALYIGNWSWPASALRMSHQQRQSIATWETAGPAPTLSDWVPYTKGDSEITIFSPSLSTPVSPSLVEFQLKAAPTVGLADNDMIELEWVQIVLPKDSSIEINGGRRIYSGVGVPTLVAPFASPHKVRTPPPGLYGVRAKIASHSDATWTPLRMFWVGQPNPSLEQFAVDDRVGGKPSAVAATEQVIVYGDGAPQEMNAQAAMGVMNKAIGRKGEENGSKAPTGPRAMGLDKPAATDGGATLLRRPQQGARPTLRPTPPDAKIQKVRPAATAGNAKAGKTKAVQRKPDQTLGELSPPVSKKAAEPSGEKKGLAPVTDKAVSNKKAGAGLSPVKK